jgi:DNA excision repair protein ERCC-2
VIRFDDQNRTLELGVHDLLEAGPPTGDLELQLAWSSRARMRAGTLAHTSWQAERADEDVHFEREVVLRHRLLVDGWDVQLQGRVDGLSLEGDYRLVEEVKSTVMDADAVTQALSRPAPFPSWVRQLQVYLWFLAEAGRPAVGRLVVVSLIDGSRHHHQVLGPGDTHSWALRQLAWLCHGREQKLAWLQRRRGTPVPFPHSTFRDGQDALTAEVEEDLHRGRQVLLTAPTGLGKTAAVLAAALRVAWVTDKRVYFATARTTQQRMAVETARLMADRGLGIRAVSIRAREKVCLNDVVACRAESCRFAAGYHDRVPGAPEDAWRAGSRGPVDLDDPIPGGQPDPDAVVVVAEARTICPFALGMDLARQADLVIGDYNYAFDPNMRLALLDHEPGDWIVVVDEAHNLPDRGMGYGSGNLPLQHARAATLGLARAAESDHRYRPAADLAAEVLDWLNAGAEQVPADAPDGEAAFTLDDGISARQVRRLAQAIDEQALDYAILLREQPWSTPGRPDPWVEVCWGVHRIRQALDYAGPETVAIWRREPHQPRRGQLSLTDLAPPPPQDDAPGLRLLCRDPSGLLGPFFGQLHAAVCMSATLSPPSFYQSVLGFDKERCSQRSYPSPFPPAHRRVLVAGDVSTLWRDRARDRDATALLISQALAGVPGNVAVYFSSFGMLESLVPLIDTSDRPVLTQARRSDEAERARMVEALLRGEGHVLFAVLGGIYAEGIDLPGSALLGAIVVGPALPAATLERRLLQQWFQERYEQGFTYAWLVPGMARVVQAAGRVLRTPEDRGAIVLIGRRFLQKDYVAFFPDDWEPRRTRDPGADLDGLWPPAALAESAQQPQD